MGTGLASACEVCDSQWVDRAVALLEERWSLGDPPDLEDHWSRHDPARSLTVLAALIKAELKLRFARGQTPRVSDYFGRFPQLREQGDRVLSLVYEEFCLCEERGDRPDPEQFCDHYAPWRDSLASQLRYHRLLSEVAGTAPPPPRFPEPGERFRGFRLRSVLGQGGAARVYLAHEEEMGNRPVALKVSPDRGREPSILGQLDHAHIVPVHSVVHEPETGLRGLCMPYRPGLPLDEVIRRIRPESRPRSARAVWDALAAADAGLMPGPEPDPDAALPPKWQGFPLRRPFPEAVAWIGLTLARALDHAHSRGILHRDVKPANILLTRREGPQLLDFNLAFEPNAADRAEAAVRGGTLPYMAPEQLEAFLDPCRWEDVDEPADLYSLGLVLREFLIGAMPPPPDPTLPVPRAIRDQLDRRALPLPSLRATNPTIPHALDAIIGRCLAYRPADRYPGARALADDLQRFLERRPLQHAPNPSKTETMANWVLRNRPALAAGLLLPLLLLAALLASWNAPRGKAERLIRQGHYREAEAFLSEPAQAHLARAWPRVLLAVARSKRNRPEAAWGDLLRKALDCDDAEEALLRAIDLEPNSSPLWNSLGWCRWFAHKDDDARDAFEQAITRDDSRSSPYHGLANIEDRRGHLDQAIAYLDQAVQRAEARPEGADRNLPLLLKERGRTRNRRAEDCQRRAAAPGVSEAERREAFRQAEGLYGKAIEDLERAAGQSGHLDVETEQRIDFLLAAAYAGMGDCRAFFEDLENAARFYDKALPLLRACQRNRQDDAEVEKALSAVEAHREKVRAALNPPRDLARSTSGRRGRDE